MKWFIYQKEKISGPLNQDEMSAVVQSLGEEKKNTLVWSRGQSEWTSADKWTGALFNKSFTPSSTVEKNKNGITIDTPHINKNNLKQTEKPIPPPPPQASLKNQTSSNEKSSSSNSSTSHLLADIKNQLIEKFKVQYDYVDQKDMTKEELIQYAQKVEDPSKLQIFDKKEHVWKDIYTLEEIVNQLGFTRRKSQRVPILAQFSGQNSAQDKVQNRIVSVSSGGMGFTDCFTLKLGETIQGQISSPHFYSPITVTAEVTYAGLDGYVGLKFTNLNDEGKAMITDYIKRFGTKD